MLKSNRNKGLSAVPVVVILMLCAVVVSIITYRVSLNVSYEATDGTYEAYETLTGNEISRPNKPGSIPGGAGSISGGSGSSSGSGGPTDGGHVCTHPTTEIRNTTATYTGDTYCAVCSTKLNEGYYIAVISCGTSTTHLCSGLRIHACGNTVAHFCDIVDEISEEIDLPTRILFKEGETFNDWFTDETRNVCWTPTADGILHGYTITGTWVSPTTCGISENSSNFSFDEKLTVDKHYIIVHGNAFGHAAPP